MRDWRKIEKRTIFDGKDEDGNRFLISFLKDYRSIKPFGEIHAGCDRCLNEYYFNLIKYLNEMGTTKIKSNYVLKIKYNGINLKFGSGIIVTNNTITDEQGDYLLKNHPRGEQLFDKIPEKKEKSDKDLTKAELKAKYPELDDKKTKKEMLADITPA